MKTFSKILLVMILGLTTLHAAAFSKDAKYRTTKVHITSDKPITAGQNTLKFSIKKDAKALSNSTVSLKAFMPAMPGMPAMVSKVDAKDLGNGVYEATLNLAMSGTWQLHIFITPKTGKKSRVKTTINF